MRYRMRKYTKNPKNKHAVRLRHVCRMSSRQHTYCVCFCIRREHTKKLQPLNNNKCHRRADTDKNISDELLLRLVRYAGQATTKTANKIYRLIIIVTL